ncbi:hypothetical protein M5K25_024722 [Dendrobium thyrsiflorum]|uniref:Uncharacterized protein n=1 Tax=Dendrobium thyrsiflorum TaxID=117978 RepID=A0ABD0U333_DENTH
MAGSLAALSTQYATRKTAVEEPPFQQPEDKELSNSSSPDLMNSNADEIFSEASRLKNCCNLRHQTGPDLMAWSKSAIRSSTSSMPTEMRMRSSVRPLASRTAVVQEKRCSTIKQVEAKRIQDKRLIQAYKLIFMVDPTGGSEEVKSGSWSGTQVRAQGRRSGTGFSLLCVPKTLRRRGVQLVFLREIEGDQRWGDRPSPTHAREAKDTGASAWNEKVSVDLSKACGQQALQAMGGGRKFSTRRGCRRWSKGQKT